MISHATLPRLLPRNDGRPVIREKDPRHLADFYLAGYYREVRDFALVLAPAAFLAAINWR